MAVWQSGLQGFQHGLNHREGLEGWFLLEGFSGIWADVSSLKIARGISLGPEGDAEDEFKGEGTRMMIRVWVLKIQELEQVAGFGLRLHLPGCMLCGLLVSHDHLGG